MTPLSPQTFRLKKSSRKLVRASMVPVVPFMEISASGMESLVKAIEATANDCVIDIGCGNGRIIDSILERYPCRGVAVEINPALARNAVEKLQKYGDRVRVVTQDVRYMDLSEATTAVTFFTSIALEDIKRHLVNSMVPGSVLLNYAYPVPGWRLARPPTDGVYKYVIGEHKKLSKSAALAQSLMAKSDPGIATTGCLPLESTLSSSEDLVIDKENLEHVQFDSLACSPPNVLVENAPVLEACSPNHSDDTTEDAESTSVLTKDQRLEQEILLDLERFALKGLLPRSQGACEEPAHAEAHEAGVAEASHYPSLDSSPARQSIEARTKSASALVDQLIDQCEAYQSPSSAQHGKAGSVAKNEAASHLSVGTPGPSAQTMREGSENRRLDSAQSPKHSKPMAELPKSAGRLRRRQSSNPTRSGEGASLSVVLLGAPLLDQSFALQDDSKASKSLPKPRIEQPHQAREHCPTDAEGPRTNPQRALEQRDLGLSMTSASTVYLPSCPWRKEFLASSSASGMDTADGCGDESCVHIEEPATEEGSSPPAVPAELQQEFPELGGKMYVPPTTFNFAGGGAASSLSLLDHELEDHATSAPKSSWSPSKARTMEFVKARGNLHQCARSRAMTACQSSDHGPPELIATSTSLYEHCRSKALEWERPPALSQQPPWLSEQPAAIEASEWPFPSEHVAASRSEAPVSNSEENYKPQSRKVSKASAGPGLWQPPNNYNFSVGAAAREPDRYPVMECRVREKYFATASQGHLTTGSAEWSKSTGQHSSPLNFSLSVRSCDPAAVYAGFLGAPQRTLRSSSSLPSIRRVAPAAMTIGSVSGFRRLLQQVGPDG